MPGLLAQATQTQLKQIKMKNDPNRSLSDKYHYTQRPDYRNLTSREAYGMTDDDAHKLLCEVRWGSQDVVQCPACGLTAKHYKRTKRRQWRCIKCQRCFSVTSDTPFADRKLPLHKLVPLFYEYATGQKGASANGTAPALGTTTMTAYHNYSKLREVAMQTQDLTPLEGVVQVDGGFFAGKPRKANRRTKQTPVRIHSRFLGRKQSIIPKKKEEMEKWNREKKERQRVVIFLRQLHPLGSGKKGAARTITVVVKSETAKVVQPILEQFIKPGSTVQSDMSPAYMALDPAKYTHQPVNHSIEYSTVEGWNNNQAESAIARMRRAEFGVYHGMRCAYMAMYAAETAWHEDTRRTSRSERFRDLIKKAMQSKQSNAFCGYKQGRRVAEEHLYVPPKTAKK